MGFQSTVIGGENVLICSYWMDLQWKAHKSLPAAFLSTCPQLWACHGIAAYLLGCLLAMTGTG